FRVPDGIVSLQIDPLSGMPATPSCPNTRAEVYIAGTQPVGSCPLHGGQGATTVAGWEVTTAQPQAPAPPAGAGTAKEAPVPAITAVRIPGPPAGQDEAQPPAEQEKDKKKGLFRKLWGVFK